MSTSAMIDPEESLQRQNDKLRLICEALMRRVEQIDDNRGAAYSQFQRAVLLEDQVRERTRDLERALDLLLQPLQRAKNARRGPRHARAGWCGVGQRDEDDTRNRPQCTHRFWIIATCPRC